MSRLLIISNRLPFSIDRTGEKITVRQSSGGLVSAIKSYFEKDADSNEAYSERLWIGSMDASEEDWKLANEEGSVDQDFRIVPIFPDKDIYEDYYNGFSNSTLWPLFHYFPSLVENRKEFFDAYRTINQLFADKIASIAQPDDVIWVHDYQLMLLPGFLRRKMPDATVGFFLHIPFPSYEIFRLMPTSWKKSLLEGMLGADLIGFHTHEYVQHFIQSAKMILQVESQFNNIQFRDRLIKVDLFPIGIDYEKFRAACTDEHVVGIATSLEEKFFNQKLIFSVDRLDYTKGLNYRLEAYEQFLSAYPEWKERVVFILNVIPSRDAIQTYSDRKRSIEEKVSTINGRFSTLHWQPLLYRYNHLSFEELCALYQVTDVALLTPLRDGMNLVAKEYIASCIDKGVLILSELTGAANELSEALLVNPTDIDEVASAIDTGLRMSLVEQRSRLSHMQRRIASYDVIEWINEFLDCMKDTKKEQEGLKVNLLNEETREEIKEAFNTSSNRCILLDYDGTLAPYQKVPSLATPGKELLDLLHTLANDDRTHVVIISGRDAKTLDQWLGHLPITLVAEHGASVRLKNQEWKDSVTISTEWKEQVRPLMELFVNRCAGSFIEEKKSTLAWHYRNTHQELGFSRSRELRNSLLQMLTNTTLQVIDGNKVLEVRLAGVDKGATAMNLLGTFHPDFVLCMGDDATDEDMFRVLQDKGFTIKIGRGNTAAQHTILSQREVLPFLTNLGSIVSQTKEKLRHTL
ncbi:MAG TPA: bifunctional alpha,alpha-trehalose-phosphate synthase (UDP-forming)/trehalose-phosphatase [Flavisolibacter sp.]|jgi:trehalose 6-phosphate synthase/phosphatase|nr:bifunctional alpha,alpha-trehalose-phosphate synthase (UDP-forming)/trehalose-phosphatase [Flavisolibacter sp.]